MRDCPWLTSVAAIVVGLSSIALAEEKKSPVASINVGVMSAYVWRSLTINDGVVVQPSLDVVHPFGLGLNVWGNLDIDDYNGKYEEREFSEVDLTVSYTLPLQGPAGVTVGYTEYLYPKEGNYNPEVPEGHPKVEPAKDADTKEVWARVSINPIDAMSFNVGVYRGVDEQKGLYGELVAAYTYCVTDALKAEAGVRMGIADKKFAQANASGTEGGLFDWGASLKLTYAVADGLSVGAMFAHVDNIDDDVFPETAVDVNWYWGLNTVLSF